MLFSLNEAFNQVIDDFSDNDFTTNPTWQGDDSVFIISSISITNGSSVPRLQLNSNSSNTSYLSTNNNLTSLDSIEWRFWARVNFNTSANNNCRVYLTSDNSDLKNSLNGYYITIGDDAGLDNISLWRQTGTSSTKIINGTIANTTIAKNYNIKVKRNNSGLWSLFCDTLGGQNYLLEGTATDLTYNTSQYTGFYCKYTISNKSNFFFDDFYNGSIQIDFTPPVLNKINILNNQELELSFSENISDQSANNISNYFVNNGIGNPANAQIQTDKSKVRLTFATPINENTTYSLSVSNITDLNNNELQNQLMNFLIYRPNIYDIVINEIMSDPDPVVGLPNAEFIELKNNTNLPINISGWLLSYGSSTRTLPECILQPDSFVVVTATNNISLFNPNIQIIGVSSLSITNTGIDISLMTPNQEIIHFVNFNDTWYNDNNKKDGGWSLEQIDPFNFCGEINNWRASENFLGGTPGFKNSVYTTNPDLILPEVLKVLVQNDSSIMVYFSESMSKNKLENLNNYSITPYQNKPIISTPTIPNLKSTLLVFNQKIEQNHIYTLTLYDTLTDCVGNKIAQNSTINFAIPLLPQPKDIVINEILSNPKNEGVDFVEIINISNKILDLKNFLLGNYSDGVYELKNITTEGFLIFPNDIVVLSSNYKNVVSEYLTYTTKNFVDMPSFPAYNNDDGVVVLTDINSVEIDKVQYSVAMHYPMLKTTDGVSLERISPHRYSTDNTNWHSASSLVGYATPGYKNSQFTDEMKNDNEITITPQIFTPDNDGNNDVCNINYNFKEIGNRINIYIYNSSGYLIKKLINNELASSGGTFSWDGTNFDNYKSETGIYIVFVEIWKTDGSVKKIKKTATLGAKF